MNKTKNDYLVLVVSFCSAAVALTLLMYAERAIASFSWFLNGLAAGLILSLSAFITLSVVSLINRFRKGWRACVPPVCSSFTAVILALLFFFGTVGQIVYSMDFQTVEETREVSEDDYVLVPGEETEIVLMVDVSASMKNIVEKVKEAANTFVSGLPENVYLAFGYFNAEAKIIVQLTLMDANGKNEVINYIKGLYIKGGTSITKALEAAYDVLDPQNNQSKNQAVVIITDGQPEKDERTIEKYTSQTAGVKLYSIRIVNSTYDSSKLKELAEKTGGFDTLIEADKDGSIDLDGLINAFSSISEDHLEPVSDKKTIVVKHTEIVFTDGLILYDDINEANAYRIIVRAVFFAVFSVLIQLLMFRDLKLSVILGAIGASAAADIIVYAGSSAGILVICSVGLALCLFTVFAKIEPEH